ncbi:MAG: mechanosensitive ion channel family protein, partial [Balneolales bacterium]|nr:mechanosensitive ion channel family protein [Balneolales bacterium]
MDDIGSGIVEYFRNSPDLTASIIETLGIILALWLIRFIILRVVVKRAENKKTQYKWRKNISYITFFIGFFVIARIWFPGIESLATFLGLLSAGIAIALKDPVTDLAAWMFIIWRRPFDVGDRIEVDVVKGDVIDVRPFKFTILEIGNWVDADQSTGRVIHVPNHYVFVKSLANYTSDFEFIWNELQVLVTFESDWKLAKKILQDVVKDVSAELIEKAKKEIKKASKSYLIEYRYLTPIVYTDVKDSGVNLTVRYLTDPRRRRGTSQAIWERILDEFNATESIDFA